MKHSQIFEIPDPEINERLIPANDNIRLTAPTMEILEAQSILAPREYIRPNRPNRTALIFTLALWAAVLAAVLMQLLK